MIKETHTSCSFCGKNKDSVKKLIVGEYAGICNECVDFCQDLLTEEAPAVPAHPSDKMDPIALKNYLDQYVIGQNAAKIIVGRLAQSPCGQGTEFAGSPLYVM